MPASIQLARGRAEFQPSCPRVLDLNHVSRFFIRDCQEGSRHDCKMLSTMPGTRERLHNEHAPENGFMVSQGTQGFGGTVPRRQRFLVALPIECVPWEAMADELLPISAQSPRFDCCTCSVVSCDDQALSVFSGN